MKISPIYPGVEDENILIHELPTELNTSTHSSLLLEVQRDKLTVKYIGKANHNHDVGGIQANRCCPPSLPLYYFELTVLDAGTRGCIAIGLADGNFQLTRQPGWDRNSFGYHGEDGRKYHDSSRGHESFRGGEAYGPVFTTGDTVGCGVLYASGDIFFTKNGNHLGTAFKRAALNVTLFPTIGLHSPSEMVQVNFGQVPFKFDLDVLFAELKEKRQKAIDDIPVSVTWTNEIVRAYLLHYAYEDALKAFDVCVCVCLCV